LTFDVSPARADEQGAALDLFFQHVTPREERDFRVQGALDLIAKGELPSDGLLVYRGCQAIVGVIVALPMPGRAGLLWPPQTTGGAIPIQAIEDSLVQHATGWLWQGGCKFAQAILALEDAPFALPLERQGFTQITTLLYLRKDLTPSTAVAGDPKGLDLQPYSSCNNSDFHDTLIASYDLTLDCPELNMLRSPEEIVAGYQAIPGCRLDRWWLARQQDRTLGVLIITATPEIGVWELLYVGLVPAARRQGLGAELTKRAMAEAIAAGATRIILTVDARNHPARQLYASQGFEEYDRRNVYLVIPADQIKT
jgi:mycothiol synthase